MYILSVAQISQTLVSAHTKSQIHNFSKMLVFIINSTEAGDIDFNDRQVSNHKPH